MSVVEDWESWGVMQRACLREYYGKSWSHIVR